MLQEMLVLNMTILNVTGFATGKLVPNNIIVMPYNGHRTFSTVQ